MKTARRDPLTLLLEIPVDGSEEAAGHIVDLAGDLAAGGAGIAAAAQLFQDDLYVHIAHGAARDDDPFSVREEDEGGVDARMLSSSSAAWAAVTRPTVWSTEATAMPSR